MNIYLIPPYHVNKGLLLDQFSSLGSNMSLSEKNQKSSKFYIVKIC